MQGRSIVHKLIIYFLLLNIITVIIVGSYSYFRAKDALMKRTIDQLTSIRIEKKYRIERLFEDRIEDIGLISKSEDVLNIYKLLAEKDISEAEKEALVFAEYSKFLKKHFLSNKYYRKFYIIGAEHGSISFTISESDSTLYFYGRNKRPLNNLYNNISATSSVSIEDYSMEIDSNSSAIFVGAPVFDNNSSLIGIVATEINTGEINSIMYENNPHNGLGESGESYLVGSDFLMRSTSRFEDNSVFSTEVRTRGVYNALEGNTGTSLINDYRGIMVISSYSRVNIPGLNWVILSEIDEAEAMVPIYSLRNNILFLGGLMSLMLFAIVYIIAKRISLPVLKLKDAAEKISGDNYDVIVDNIASKDEIGSLVAAFNEMSGRIKEQREKLKLERSMRLSSMIDGQELERLRLSRELHDGLGQSILAVKLRLERCTNAPAEKAREIMEEVDVLISNIINEIRNISNNLMPAELSQLGLTEALKKLCRDMSKSSGIELNFTSSEIPGDINEKINTYLYRISQEGLNNIVKHSDASRGIISLAYSDNILILSISDNGRGFNNSEERKLCGNGIPNMNERVHLLGGELDIYSEPGNGTKIDIRIRLENKNGQD